MGNGRTSGEFVRFMNLLLKLPFLALSMFTVH